MTDFYRIKSNDQEFTAILESLGATRLDDSASSGDEVRCLTDEGLCVAKMLRTEGKWGYYVRA